MFNTLYVEDDPGSRRVMEMIERMHPDMLNVTIFENSTDFETRFLALGSELDLILLDIHVAPYTGFQMLDIIRSHPQYNNLPIIALTASVMNEEIEILKQSGFQGVIAKPLNIDEFPNLVQQIMNGKAIWYVW